MKENINKNILKYALGGMLRPTKDLSSEFKNLDTDTLKLRARDFFQLKHQNLLCLKKFKTMLDEGKLAPSEYKSLEDTYQEIVNLSYSADLELSRRQPTIIFGFHK